MLFKPSYKIMKNALFFQVGVEVWKSLRDVGDKECF